MSIFTTHTELVSALFADLEQAENVVAQLHKAGVPGQEISVLADGAPYPQRNLPEVQGLYLEKDDSTVEDSFGVGAAIGGTGGFLAGLSVVAIPGVGPFLVLGTALLSAIAGMSVGALAGGAVAILVELGFKKELAEKIQDSLKSGQVLVAAKAESASLQEIQEIIQKHDPVVMLEKHTVE
jgi:peptidyl-tRNA hydrolase